MRSNFLIKKKTSLKVDEKDPVITPFRTYNYKIEANLLAEKHVLKKSNTELRKDFVLQDD